MLDKTTTEALDDIAFSDEEIEAFRAARLAGDGLRRGFDAWIAIGHATKIARRHADLPGGTQRVRGARFRAILDREGFAMVQAQRRRANLADGHDQAAVGVRGVSTTSWPPRCPIGCPRIPIFRSPPQRIDRKGICRLRRDGVKRSQALRRLVRGRAGVAVCGGQCGGLRVGLSG
jgi:hypothetical protein